jgi:hypothetical protein
MGWHLMHRIRAQPAPTHESDHRCRPLGAVSSMVRLTVPLRVASVRPDRMHRGQRARRGTDALGGPGALRVHRALRGRRNTPSAGVVVAASASAFVAVLALCAPAARAAITPPPAGAPTGLHTGIEDYAPRGPEGALMVQRMRAAGSSVMKIVVSWSQIAPAEPPPGFAAGNPFSPGYDWYELDREVNLAVASGQEPFVVLYGAPNWAAGAPGTMAGGGIYAPDPSQLAQFARAAALRYDGTRAGLPRVRYWGVWNEPNVSLFLAPQVQAGAPVSIARYRAMVNGVAGAVKSVRADNLVVAGELFPNGIMRSGLQAIAPLAFLRGLLCMSGRTHPRPTCHTRVSADIVSVHPYTSGGPSDRPANPDNVWIGNLSSMRALIVAAQRSGNLVSAGAAGMWVSEFGWNTAPPSSRGVPVSLDARWISEALYLMSRSGVSLAVYFGLRDGPPPPAIFQTGLYYSCPGGAGCDRPKPGLAAFRFPFVAYATSRKRQVAIWGRTPAGAPGTVQIQSSAAGGRWRLLSRLSAGGDGLFTGRLQIPGKGSIALVTLRAVLAPGFIHAAGTGAVASRGFALKRPPDLRVTPFG